MEQIQIAYKNSPDFITKLLQLKNYHEDNSLEQVLFYITWAGEVKGKLDTVIDKIEEIFPDSIYYGNESSGNIASGDFSYGIHITVYLFESSKTKAELVWVEKGTKIPSLTALWTMCRTKRNLKGIELLPSLSYAEFLKIDQDVPPIDKNVLIFGGTASGYILPCTSADVIAKGHPRTSEGMPVILYSGEDLHFFSDYILGWQGLGKLMTITKAEGKNIKEIDGVTPKTIYQRYLGPILSQDESYIFPLIVYEDGIEFLRTPHEILEDETMNMFVSIPKGTNVRLSYGDKNSIMETAHRRAIKVSNFRPEAIKAYSCAARRLFWGDEEVGKETKILDQLAPVCGFYSSGEIIRFGDKLRLCNQTLSVVSFREFEGKDAKPIKVENQEADNSMVSRLAFFTRKVTQEQEEALAMAQKASKAKTDFLFNMSHDIRTPMNAIIGFTNIATRELKTHPDRALESIQKVQNSSDILLSIINDILDMSRIESGKTKLKFENIDINSIINKIEPVMKNLAAPKDILLSFSTINLQNNYVRADVPFIQRILINIISNAIKYTNGGGRVDVTLEECEGPEPNIRLYKYVVKDNGIGMSEEFQKHMFEEFSREETSTVSGIQGTGLGLSLALKLTQFLGGTIECQSKQGVGSTFTISFPLKVVSEDQIDSIRINETLKFADFRGKRVLIVEDNVLNREIALDIMKEEGVEADTAENGQIAVDVLKEKGPAYYDFILMDIQMPIMNGYEATKAIRELYPTENIIIIAVSANAFQEDKAASVAAGMNDHVAKPIDIAELKQVMAKYLPNE